jgi:hypothetical protein
MSLGSGITPEWVLEKRALERRVQELEDRVRELESYLEGAVAKRPSAGPL